METYGVSFEGFEPSCGWPLYRHIENEVLPYLKGDVERWRGCRDGANEERAALKSIKVDLEGLVGSREALVEKLKKKISGTETTLGDVMPLAVRTAKIKTENSWPELSSWLDAAKMPLAEIALFYKQACERAEENFTAYDSLVESMENSLRFWEQTLELQKAYWIFEKAELKYKTKICRDLVKMLGGYVADCRAQLNGLEESWSRETAVYEDVDWLFNEAKEDLAYYRQIKADIAAVGVEEALKHSSRKVTQPHAADAAATEQARNRKETAK